MAEINKSSELVERNVPAMPEPEEEAILDLTELLHRVLAKWKQILLVGIILAMVFGAREYFFTTPMYSAKSTIYILGNRDSLLSMADLQIGTALTDDYIKVFKIWEVHEKVIQNLGLPYSYQAIQGGLSVSNDTNTRMLDIVYHSQSPEEAAMIANEYAKVGSQYIAETMSTEAPSIMSVALVPTAPYNINVSRQALLGFLLGAALVCGIVLIQYLTDDKYKSAEDIRKYTGLITLATIPKNDIDEILDGEAGRKRK